MYSSHIYPWKGNWQRNTLAAAAKYPIFVGEVGCPPDYKGFQFISPSERHPLEGWPRGHAGPDPEVQAQLDRLQLPSRVGPMVILALEIYCIPYWGVL